MVAYAFNPSARSQGQADHCEFKAGQGYEQRPISVRVLLLWRDHDQVNSYKGKHVNAGLLSFWGAVHDHHGREQAGTQTGGADSSEHLHPELQAERRTARAWLQLLKPQRAPTNKSSSSEMDTLTTQKGQT